MTRRRSVRGALHNYLATLTSRYSDLDGYWILGLVVADLGELSVDLLSESTVETDSAPMAALVRMARGKFHEQMEKERLPPSVLGSARLEIARTAPASGHVNGHVVAGHEVTFIARVESDLRSTYVCRKSVFVAPHNADIESRSRRREG